MKSVMAHNFAEAPTIDMPRSSFDMSFGYKTTLDADYLIPVFRFEALPGDTVTVNPNMFARINTPVYPVIDNLSLDIQFFSVPVRQVWTNWRKFMGEQVDPGDSIDYTVPVMAATATTGYSNQSLHDYLGLPTKVPDYEHSALYHRAYNHIYNEWYRDENLIDSADVDKDDGPDSPGQYLLRKRGKRHDYFTSCLPWLQKPDATYANGVTLPLGTTAPIQGTGADTYVNNDTDSTDRALWMATGTATNIGSQTTPSGADKLNFSSDSTKIGLEVDLSAATAATVNQLRQAFQIQKLLERDARSGTRYPEIIASHFGGVKFLDASYRPEFLSSATTPVQINSVPQTSETGTTPQGTLAAYGTAMLSSGGFTKSFSEHCLVLGIASVKADLTYQQGLHRDFTRQTRYDYFWPELQHIGEQSVPTIELYCQDPTTDTGSTGTPDNEKIFGYQERYGEYKYKPSLITGKLRSNDAATLDAWHLSQEFSSLPTLNQTFIESTTPMDRVVAVTTEPDFLMDCYFEMRVARPMSIYSTPGLIDHF